MNNQYNIKELTSPDHLTKKVFKFGHTVAWITTMARDNYKIDEWGKVSETKYAIYFATTVYNNLRKEGWK